MKVRIKYEDGPCAADAKVGELYADTVDDAKYLLMLMVPKAMITSAIEVADEVNETNKVKKMAKETKAERQAREETELAMYKAEQEATYPARLMNTLQRAQAANFELDARNDCTFQLYDRDERGYDEFEVDYFYSESANEDLDRLEREVSRKEEQTAEENRKFLVKQSALAKLSKEEKELLGL